MTRKDGIKVVTKMLNDIKYRAKFYQKQLKILSIDRDIYRALLLCRDDGAIMMSTGKIARKIEADNRFEIIGEGYMKITASTIFDEMGARQIDWKYNIQDETTTITIYLPNEDSTSFFTDKKTLANNQKINELPYRIAIFQLKDYKIQQMCDELYNLKKINKCKIEFELQIMLVKSDLTKVEEYNLPDTIPFSDPLTINQTLKPKFRKTEEFIDNLQ